MHIILRLRALVFYQHRTAILSFIFALPESGLYWEEELDTFRMYCIVAGHKPAYYWSNSDKCKKRLALSKYLEPLLIRLEDTHDDLLPSLIARAADVKRIPQERAALEADLADAAHMPSLPHQTRLYASLLDKRYSSDEKASP